MITIREATTLDALHFAGGKAFLRRALAFQVRRAASYLVERDGKAVALGMLWRWRARRYEFALVVKPEAAAVMPGLIRLAHLTLSRIAQNGILVFANIRQSDTRAQRMARITGFAPGGMRDPAIWFFRGVSDDRYHRHVHRQDPEGHGGGPSPATQTAGRGPGAAAFGGSPGDSEDSTHPQEPQGPAPVR